MQQWIHRESKQYATFGGAEKKITFAKQVKPLNYQPYKNSFIFSYPATWNVSSTLFNKGCKLLVLIIGGAGLTFCFSPTLFSITKSYINHKSNSFFTKYLTLMTIINIDRFQRKINKINI